MKQKKQPQSRKKTLILCGILCLAIIALGSVVLWKQKHTNDTAVNTSHTSSDKPQTTINYDPPTTDQKNTSEQQKEDIINNDTSTPTPSSSIVVSIVRAGQLNNGQAVQIRTLISGATSGSCTATLTKNGAQTVKKTGTIVREATSVSCEGLDVDASEFSADGTWDLSVTATSNNLTSAAATQKVNVVR